MTEHDYDNGYLAGMQKMRDIAQARIDEMEENSDGDAVEYIRVDVHEARIKRLEDKISHLEEMRPFWAMGYSSDSMAAQAATGALSNIWRCLGVKDQTACMYALKELKTQEENSND
jgi:hypothetical protein